LVVLQFGWGEATDELAREDNGNRLTILQTGTRQTISSVTGAWHQLVLSSKFKQLIVGHIPWDKLPWTSTPLLFKCLKEEIR
jgi:hypothetical protein